MSYQKPTVRDYGDVAEVTAAVLANQSDDGVQKSSDLALNKG